MATAKDLERLALALAGMAIAPHFDRTAFKVARIQATLAADGESVNLKLTPDEQELKCLTAPEAFAPVPSTWGQQGWTAVRLGSLSGSASGVAAAYDWTGKKSGAGRMQVATSEPWSKVTMDLDLTKSFVANNKTEFTVASRETSTKVTWAMTGSCGSYFRKLMGTIFNMGKMVDGEFAKGLASLKMMVQITA